MNDISALIAIADLQQDPYSLPAKYYLDADILEQEYARIFSTCWNFAGYTAQLNNAGDFVTCRAGDEGIIVIRSDDGELRAFFNVCRHRGHVLMKGAGRVNVITCPYHAWTYATDGRLRYARHSEKVKDFDPNSFCLKAVAVQVYCGMVFVNLAANPSPMTEEFPGLEQELRDYEPRIADLHFVFRREVVIEANWKLVVENYNENYHTPVVHPVLAQVLDEDYRVTQHGRYIRHTSSVNPAAKGGFDVEASRYNRHLNWWVWPGLCLMSIPEGGFRVLNIIPDGVSRSRETYDFYLPYAQPTDAQWKQIYFACDTVNAEDIGVCEGVQQGLRSRSFDRGRIMVDPVGAHWSEHAVAHIRNLVRDALA